MSDPKVSDYLANHSDSNRLARNIKRYWKKYGIDVDVVVQRETDPYEHWSIRSNLVEVLTK